MLSLKIETYAVSVSSGLSVAEPKYSFPAAFATVFSFAVEVAPGRPPDNVGDGDPPPGALVGGGVVGALVGGGALELYRYLHEQVEWARAACETHGYALRVISAVLRANGA